MGKTPSIFERIARIEAALRAVGVVKNEDEIIQLILHRLPARYEMEKYSILTAPGFTRMDIERKIRAS